VMMAIARNTYITFNIYFSIPNKAAPHRRWGAACASTFYYAQTNLNLSLS
jgi:hypothetical protein